MYLNVNIFVLLATALQGDEGKKFLLSIKIDGCDRGSHISQSEVALSDIMVWLPKRKDETDGNTNEFNFIVEEFSSITFELRSASRSQGVSLTAPLIARFSTTIDDLCYQRNLAVIRLRESFALGSQVGSRELYLQVVWMGYPPHAPNAGRRQRNALALGSRGSFHLGYEIYSSAIHRCLLAMKPNAKTALVATSDWGAILSERGIISQHSEPRCHIPYILSRAFELNVIFDEPDGVNLTRRDLGIPSVLIYANSVDPWLPSDIETRAPYSKFAFVENLDQAHVWILRIKGQYHGRKVVHGLEFQDASESLLRVAFAEIFPLFRLMLQVGGTLEIHTEPHSLMELEFLENSPELKVPGSIWYSFSRYGCFICEEPVPEDAVERMDFGELVPHEQKVLPQGRDAVDILSQHFSSLLPSLRKVAPDGNPSNIESIESTHVPQNFKLFG